MKSRLPWGLLLPPLCSLMIAGGIVRYQSVRHANIAAELRSAGREIARLEKMLPAGHPAAHPLKDADQCDDEHHSH